MKRLSASWLFALIGLLVFSTAGQARSGLANPELTSSVLGSLVGSSSNRILLPGIIEQPENIQLAHHTAEEWAEFLRKRRAKRKRLRRQRANGGGTSKKQFSRKTRKSRLKRRKVARASAKRKSLAKKRANLFARTEVKFPSREKPGTLIVETKSKHLYYIVDGKNAIRYGVAVGKQGFAWSGTSTVKRKIEWPTWYPPKEMIQRKPSLKKWKNGQPGGPGNPLGAAALYLFQGEKDTLYRIHGTNAPSSIGTAASSGCIRMRNEDIQHLYSKVNNGTKVIVR